MTKLRLFLTVAFCLSFMLAAGATAGPVPAKKAQTNPDLVVQLPDPGKAPRMARDDDDFMTLRFMVSTDGGENWSEIMSTGDCGMYMVDGEDTVNAWGSASYDFGTIVDLDNNLHFVVVLNAFSEEEGLNPFGRVNGVYDVKTDVDGNAAYTLIAEETGGTFTWSDVGMDVDGNLYAMWVRVVEPEEGDPYGEIWVSKSVDAGDNWGDPVLLTDELDPTHNYPHITPHIGEYFYIIYELPNVDTGLFDHFVLKMASSLEGEPEVQATGASSAIFYSYYVGSVSPIDQDVNEGYIYFAVRNEDVSATTVGNSDGGGEWTLEAIDGAQRYPSVMMWPSEEGGMPWVFSNFGVGNPGEYHKNWFSYDGLGYNGGDWLPQTPLDSVMWDGTRSLLYCHNGVVTTEGRLVTGCNVWGQFTPEGYRVKYSDDGGENFADAQQLWSIFDQGLRGGYIAQCMLNAGMDNTVWVAFCGQYGETDFDPPVIDDNITLSSFVLNEPWVVSANITDELSPVTYADINWTTGDPADPEAPWDYTVFDSSHVDEDGYGDYFFTLPSDSMFGEALADGDEVWFYIFAMDESGNMGASWECRIVVGQSYEGVPVEETVPTDVALGQNYPNPFNNATVIPFSLDRATDVKPAVYDLNGRLVSTLLDGAASAGRHTVTWCGDGFTSGVYFYVLEAAGQRHIAKFTLLR